jgi:hypothetical protein
VERPYNRNVQRASRIWQGLEREQRLAAGAAAALFVTMFLPWYQQNAVVNARGVAPLISRNLNAWAVFSFVEAAVLLVAVAVLVMLAARGEGRDFHLPGSDGAIVMLAGAWVALLLIWRLFDKPSLGGRGVAGNVGIQWGIFFALAAAGTLIWAGSRMRAAQRPEPPFIRPRPHPHPPREDRPARPPAPEPPTQQVRPARRGQPADWGEGTTEVR